MNRTALVLGVVSAIGVLVLAMAAAERKSPGRVSSVHNQVADLHGGESCSKCHGGWFGDMRSACSECHADVAAQVADHHGLHGTFAAGLAANCATCHGEHHGDEFRLVNRLAFAQAGVADPQTFDHARIGFVMAGAHLTLECKACHLHADDQLLPEGQKRFLGLSQDCASCHADPHGGRMQFGCATCHGQSTFQERFVVDHDRWLSLNGAHGAVECRQCHAAGAPHALEALRRGAHEQARQCADCHATPHSASFVLGNASAAAVDAKAVCVQCHSLEFPTFQDMRATVTPEQHVHGGFALGAPHDRVACAMCHAPNSSYAQRHPGRQADDCRACHSDPHGGQFDTGPFAATGCVACHDRTRFAPHAFDAAHHARTQLPLDGKHAEIDCSKCHAEPTGDAPRRFQGTPNRCEQCHDDAHEGAFAPVDEALAANPRGRCAECHGTRAFAQLDHERFDHGRWTGFPVDGAHGQIECTDCHARTAQPDALGRRFGRVPTHGEGFRGCVTCHGDPHDGVFDKPGVPSEVEGRRTCQRCHDTASFRALPHGFDHGAFAKWPLQGAHAKLDCAACHEPLAATAGTGRTWGKARGRECADCHHDPHQGQFERLGKTDCFRCHKSTIEFASLSFRHNLDSRFQLGDQHAKVGCAECHKPELIRGSTVARYTPMAMECVSCHGNEAGGAGGRRRRR
ncbi:MAG TPA: cytochrome c3 family protein [Planctomycetota bacterium]|nr:cytochrome c3 family protein [Planctomycetota bacterium]